MSKLRTDLHDYLIFCVNNGIDDPGKFSEAVLDAAKILERICTYIEKHGTISLSCGSEWMYQSDRGQIDALDLVSKILDDLEGYAEKENENE
ncbi:hypothetical protein [Flavonifractor sp. An4]|uniref:hypothetical protein n=1 Tax=Flavonifractor sp. An4 TaxID=1965634 RepID=UPI000B385B6E|nr:hypothetical protein [Flavonifractor sp. An4]OUO16170.1 hypothetical protein B5F94_05790 [Flavonifractor sp. An4]